PWQHVAPVGLTDQQGKYGPKGAAQGIGILDGGVPGLEHVLPVVGLMPPGAELIGKLWFTEIGVPISQVTARLADGAGIALLGEVPEDAMQSETAVLGPGQ